MTVLYTIGFFLFLFVFVSVLYSVPVMFLWNWICPTLFGLPEITLFQSWGLIFLCSLLFKSNSNSLSKSKEKNTYKVRL